jgi:hypothetical protein
MSKLMPPVTECTVSDCAYNRDNLCHTLAITVGGPEDCPHCDTYSLALKGGVPEQQGAVGACKVPSCLHNSALECSASSITVGWHENHPDCRTYSRKQPRP